MLYHDRTIFAVLEFGSAAMLGWLAAAAAPWLIHLWNNRRPRKMPWAAMDLLFSAVHRRSRRIHFQQWLLLAVRTTILALVALAAAQPVWRQWAWGGAGSQRTHHVIVVDRSYSMSCTKSERSRFARAQRLAQETIELAATGDLFSLIGWSQHAENILGQPTFQAYEVIAAIDDMNWSHTPAALAAALRAVEQAIARAKEQHPEIAIHRTTIFSDMARNTWQPDPIASAEVETLCQRLAMESELIVVPIDTPDVGKEDAKWEQHGNLAVTSLTANPLLAIANDPVAISATIRALGEPSASLLEVVLSVDGVTVDRKRKECQPDEEETVQFDHRFVDTGQHTIRVSIEYGRSEDAKSEAPIDCLSLDNRRWMVLEVREQVQVACIAGKLDAAKDLARALAPHLSKSTQLNNSTRLFAPSPMGDGLGEGKIRPGPVNAETIPASRLEETDLSRFDAVFLCNVAELSERDTVRLARFAQGGGALAFFLGDQVLVENFQGLLDKLQLPLRIGLVKQGSDLRFRPLEYQHPILKVFRGRENSGLLSVQVLQYFPLEIIPSEIPLEAVLAIRSENRALKNSIKQDGVLVVGTMGLGRVAVVGLPASLASRTATGAPWSSLAINPSFLPLVRELLAYIVGDREHREFNLLVGKPLAGLANATHLGQDISIRTPNGQLIHQVPTDDANNGAYVFADTWQSGIYTIYSGDSSVGAPGDATSNELARFALNLDTRESDLSTIFPDDLPPGISLNRSTAAGSRSQSISYARLGDISLQHSLFAIALALLLIELLIAWWIGRGWGSWGRR